MDFKRALEQYIEYQKYFKRLSLPSIRRTRQELTWFAKQTSIDTLSQVTEAALHRYFLEGSATYNWKSSTICTKRLTFSPFFKWSISKGYMNSNPLAAIPAPKVERTLPERLNKDQAIRLLEVVYHYPCKNNFIRHRNHAMLAICLYAGLRKTEMLTIKFADVDVINMTIFIRKGKGNKDRIIPMSSTLAEILREYCKERTKLNTKVPEFFCGYTGVNPVDFTAFRRAMCRYIKVSGISFSLHRLRHTFATLLLEGGCDIFSLSKMMGHTHVATTALYLAASPEHLRVQMFKHPLNSHL